MTKKMIITICRLKKICVLCNLRNCTYLKKKRNLSEWQTEQNIFIRTKKNKNELVSVYLSVYTSNNIINLPIKEKESNQMFEYSTYI